MKLLLLSLLLLTTALNGQTYQVTDHNSNSSAIEVIDVYPSELGTPDTAEWILIVDTTFKSKGAWREWLEPQDSVYSTPEDAPLEYRKQSIFAMVAEFLGYCLMLFVAIMGIAAMWASFKTPNKL